MSIAEYAIRHRIVSTMLALLLLIGGGVSFFSLGQLEDPAFTLKTAMVITHYPGASPLQVEEEVTYPLENVIQQLPYVDFVTSVSSAGMSQITVEMKSTYRQQELKQIWDELRRKVNDLYPSLPPGVKPPRVMDDFGDVYGVLLAISGNNYSYEELADYVDFLRRELVLVNGVAKVTVAGEQQQQVIVELSTRKLANLGIPSSRIYQLLQNQNGISNAGKIQVGGELIRLHPTGEFEQVDELEQLIISSAESAELIYLGDVAEVFKGYREVPDNLTRYNGKPALLLGISFSSGVNVVQVGERLAEHMRSLEYQRPIGIEVDTVYHQPNEVEQSVKGFLASLIQAVAIVIVVLLLFMGLKSGLLIGLILLLTVLGTFIFMNWLEIDLQRISLGALIIALGMLVDNAIVVTEGILIGLKRGKSTLTAANDIVKQTQWPLLGATVIGITAFAPIGLSSDASGEFAGSLFYVLLISLFLSWFTAITLTPFFASLLFRQQSHADNTSDPYQGVIFDAYGVMLNTCLRYRKTTVFLMLLALGAAVVNFSQIKQSFFPSSNTPMFYIDYWRYQGSDIRRTQADLVQLEQFLLMRPEVVSVASTIGQGAPRLMLTYSPQKRYPGYAQLIVRLEQQEQLVDVIEEVREYAQQHVLNAQIKIKPVEIGPSNDAKIEARFSGPDPAILRQLAEQAKTILRQDANAFNIRDDWRQLSKVIRPQFNESIARRLGISKADLDQRLLTTLTGLEVGLYREGTQMLPIVVRSPEAERLHVENLQDIQIFSPALGIYVPASQVVDDFTVEWEDSLIMRRDRKRTITVMADHDLVGEETAARLFQRVHQDIEAISLPHGYEFSWGGEFESSSKAQRAVFGSLPLGYLAMFMITILLFNSLRQPLVIWATVPLAIIGVSFGLSVMNSPFSFMALLGLLSLSGMLIKNGIVLVDQINIDMTTDKSPYQAIFDSSRSRVRPVAMAAITTILGMIPLLFDVFFNPMAVTIMFGLGFATVLTLLIVPVMYAMCYRIHSPPPKR